MNAALKDIKLNPWTQCWRLSAIHSYEMHSKRGQNKCCSINIQSPSADWRGWWRRRRAGNVRKKSRSERDVNRRKEKEKGGGRRRGGGRWSDSRGWERRRNRGGKVSVRRGQKARGVRRKAMAGTHTQPTWIPLHKNYTPSLQKCSPLCAVSGHIVLLGEHMLSVRSHEYHDPSFLSRKLILMRWWIIHFTVSSFNDVTDWCISGLGQNENPVCRLVFNPLVKLI